MLNLEKHETVVFAEDIKEQSDCSWAGPLEGSPRAQSCLIPEKDCGAGQEIASKEQTGKSDLL